MFNPFKILSYLKFYQSETKIEEEPTIIENLSTEEKEKVKQLLKQKREEELSNPPTIAIIGKTGVGKSSTINNLFKTNLDVSHSQSCTQKGTPIKLTNGKGEIIIYDMPGLGEDEDKDEEHKKEYRKILPQCDVVLWIMNIADREMSSQQRYIREILTYLDGKLVICANKADNIHPENWNISYNMPSNEQHEILENRIKDIRSKLCKIIPDLKEELIVYYSATKRFKLNDLFGAMLEACPNDREWVMNERIDIEDFKELIAPEILKKLNNDKI